MCEYIYFWSKSALCFILRLAGCCMLSFQEQCYLHTYLSCCRLSTLKQTRCISEVLLLGRFRCAAILCLVESDRLTRADSMCSEIISGFCGCSSAALPGVELRL